MDIECCDPDGMLLGKHYCPAISLAIVTLYKCPSILRLWAYFVLKVHPHTFMNFASRPKSNVLCPLLQTSTISWASSDPMCPGAAFMPCPHMKYPGCTLSTEVAIFCQLNFQNASFHFFNIGLSSTHAQF